MPKTRKYPLLTSLIDQKMAERGCTIEQLAEEIEIDPQYEDLCSARTLQRAYASREAKMAVIKAFALLLQIIPPHSLIDASAAAAPLPDDVKLPCTPKLDSPAIGWKTPIECPQDQLLPVMITIAVPHDKYSDAASFRELCKQFWSTLEPEFQLHIDIILKGTVTLFLRMHSFDVIQLLHLFYSRQFDFLRIFCIGVDNAVIAKAVLNILTGWHQELDAFRGPPNILGLTRKQLIDQLRSTPTEQIVNWITWNDPEGSYHTITPEKAIEIMLQQIEQLQRSLVIGALPGHQTGDYLRLKSNDIRFVQLENAIHRNSKYFHFPEQIGSLIVIRRKRSKAKSRRSALN